LGHLEASLSHRDDRKASRSLDSSKAFRIPAGPARLPNWQFQSAKIAEALIGSRQVRWYKRIDPE
jgi:hypothetical protein